MSSARKIAARFVGLGLAVPMLLAAAPAPNGFLGQTIVAEATIGTGGEMPPRGGADGFTAAPIPDLDREAPPSQQVASDAPYVAPKLFHKQTLYHGEGYVFGSTAQEQTDRKVEPVPGINLIMPLQ